MYLKAHLCVPFFFFVMENERDSVCLYVPRTNKYVADSRVAPMFRVIPCPPFMLWNYFRQY